MKTILNGESVSEFKKLLDDSKKIVLTCHVRPDGDAIGSTLGLYHLLRVFGKEVNVVVPDRLPRSLTFLPGSRDIVVNTQYEELASRLISEADLIIMCDFNTHSREGNLGEIVKNAGAAKVLIDHHRNPDIKCDVMFSYPDMSSTCELVFRLIAACGLWEDVNVDAATCILTGIITDTRNFTVNCDDSEIYEILVRLIDKGVDKKKIIDEALNSTKLDALRLNSFAILERLEIYEKSRCALITLSADDLSRFNYQKGDTEGLVNIPLDIRGIVYSVFMREDSDCIKVSCRSKFDFPVCNICEDLFDGGGHLMAAGGEFNGTLEECKKILLRNIHHYDKFLPSNLERLEL